MKLPWIMAFALPIVREFNLWILIKISQKAANGDVKAVDISCSQLVGTLHSFFLAITVGSIATNATCAITIGTDFLMNLWICIKLIHARRKRSIDIENQIELLQTLVINEMIEFVVPIVYVLCLLAAYYGPNAELIGNVRNSYWQYSAIEDISHTILYVSIFFMIDLGSLIVTSFLLWTSYRISVYKAYVEIQKEFGFLIWFTMAAAINAVSNIFDRSISIKYRLW